MKKHIAALLLSILCVAAVFGQDVPGTLKFPTAFDSLDSLFRTTDRAASFLSSGINASVDVIPLNNASLFPASGAVVIGNEVIYYTAKSGNTLTGAIRGASGTTAASHISASQVRGAIVSAHHNTQSQALINLQTKLGFGISTPTTGTFLKATGTGQTVWSALAASDIASGIFSPARLGSGTADDTTCLRGDSSWVACASGGVSIGGEVESGTDGSLLFVAGGNLAQNNSKLFWDNTTNKENLQVTSGGDSDTASLSAANILFDGGRGLKIRSTNAGQFFPPHHLRFENAAYGTFGTLQTANQNGFYFGAGPDALWHFSSGLSGGTSSFIVRTSSAALANAVANINTGYATQRGLEIKLAASQSANAFEIQPNGSTTPIFQVNNLGNLTFNNGSQIVDSSLFSLAISSALHLELNAPATRAIYISAGGVNSAMFDGSATSGDTRFFVYDVDNGTMERVTVGSADSCGVGFKCLRIPN